jgi:hypothetical protein
MTEAGPDLEGARMFVRYAYPPNALGYCGPDGFRDYAEAGVVDQGLVQKVQAFSGAWPYLELISAGGDIKDPLDRRVVEAYWVGNELLDRVLIGKLGDSMAERFRKQLGNKFQFLAEGVLAGGVPHHSFHVFGVYPWVGMLGNDKMAGHALNVLDRCRIRWGKVTALHGDQVAVEFRPLCWDGRLLTLGPPTHEKARLSARLRTPRGRRDGARVSRPSAGRRTRGSGRPRRLRWRPLRGAGWPGRRARARGRR